MTHEFKTPIATINIASDALKNEKVINDRERIKYYAELIKQENKRMNTQWKWCSEWQNLSGISWISIFRR